MVVITASLTALKVTTVPITTLYDPTVPLWHKRNYICNQAIKKTDLFTPTEFMEYTKTLTALFKLF